MKDTHPVIPLDLPQRRSFLLTTFRTAGAVGLTGFLAACGSDDDGDAVSPPVDNGNPKPPTNDPKPPVEQPFNPFAKFSALQAADANGVMLPKGFTSRIVARSSQAPVAGGTFKWHAAPDGGACFPAPDGGWVYTSNSETEANETGGASALRFDKTGKVIDAYAILKETSGNCAGGPTPWGTWMSCEETDEGLVWDCDPFKPWVNAASAPSVPALGRYGHEAICVDKENRTIYLTEDASGGRVYRFVCSASDWPAGAARPQMKNGKLQTLRLDALERDADTFSADGQKLLAVGKPPASVSWEDVLSPDQPQITTRTKLTNVGIKPPGNYFQKAEGIWFFNGIVFFVTSFNHRIWAYDVANSTLEVIFDGGDGTNADGQHSINQPDNITITSMGSMLVAEDSGNLEISVLREDDNTSQPVMRLVGQDLSEITGPAVSPDGKRLYFSSQRGTTNDSNAGITFEVLLPTKLVM